jgi:hypothetical protein
MEGSRLGARRGGRRPTDGVVRGSRGEAQAGSPSNRTNCPTNRKERPGRPRAVTQIWSRAVKDKTRRLVQRAIRPTSRALPALSRRPLRFPGKRLAATQ